MTEASRGHERQNHQCGIVGNMDQKTCGYRMRDCSHDGESDTYDKYYEDGPPGKSQLHGMQKGEPKRRQQDCRHSAQTPRQQRVEKASKEHFFHKWP